MTRIRIALMLAALTAAASFAHDVSIRLENGAFQVTGWTPAASPGGWASILQVYAGTGDLPPMLGAYAVEQGSLIFRPRFPLAPRIRYRAVFHPAGGKAVERVFDAIAPPESTTVVEHVYPSSSALPANQLKLYVRFSAPMGRGEAWKHIRLVDEKGVPVELAFLEIDQELWDREFRQITLLFDPGRIKRGVLPREQVGSALVEGRRYTLEIDRDWPDARGVRLAADYRKSFVAAGEDREPVEPRNWRIAPPAAASRHPLAVEFPEPLDAALLQHLLSVKGPRGAVRGTVEVDRDERRWRFTPGAPWAAGEYQLIVDTRLEDLAGNRVGRVFDVDVFERVTEERPAETVSLPFRIGRQ